MRSQQSLATECGEFCLFETVSHCSLSCPTVCCITHAASDLWQCCLNYRSIGSSHTGLGALWFGGEFLSVLFCFVFTVVGIEPKGQTLNWGSDPFSFWCFNSLSHSGWCRVDSLAPFCSAYFESHFLRQPCHQFPAHLGIVSRLPGIWLSPLVLVQDSIVIKHHCKKQKQNSLGRKGCFRPFRSFPSLKSLRAGTEAGAMDECSLLACSLKLAQPAFLCNSRLPARMWQCPEWAGPSHIDHLPRKCP